MSNIAVVGAGIVGSTIAARLLLDGHAVTVYEPEPDGLPTSSGNASLIALPEIAPIASPGILASVPKWLLDPLGPLAVRWPDLPALTPWLVAFLASATPSHGAKVRAALAQLMRTALTDHQSLATSAGLSGFFRETGYLSLHDSEASVSAGLHEAEHVRQVLGFGYERLSPEDARKLVPQVEGPFVGAIHQPVYWTVSNPLTLLRAYQTFVRGRATLVPERVSALSRDAAGIAVHTPQGRALHDRVVVAAGVWSRDLVRSLGAKVLLENERGYNTTFTDLGWNLPMPVGFADHAFIATPLVDGLRVGGAVEMAKPDTPPNYGRAKAMRAKMRRYVPSLPEGGKEWMGRRPSTPDSLPVVGPHPGDDRVVYAFGHGHLGLTLSAVTARLVAALVSGTPSGVEMTPFSIERFQ
jgi:D-amino-acid dehydrogenase